MSSTCNPSLLHVSDKKKRQKWGMKTRAEAGGHTGESHFGLDLIQHFNNTNKSDGVMVRCVIQTAVIKLPALV